MIYVYTVCIHSSVSDIQDLQCVMLSISYIYEQNVVLYQCW